MKELKKMQKFYQIKPNYDYDENIYVWGHKIISNLSSEDIYDNSRIYFTKEEVVNALEKMAKDCYLKVFDNSFDTTLELPSYDFLDEENIRYMNDVDYTEFAQCYIPEIFKVIEHKFNIDEDGAYILKYKYEIKPKKKNGSTELYDQYKLVLDD